MHTHTHAHVHTPTRAHAHPHVCTHLHIHVCTCISTPTHIHMHTCICTQPHVCMYTCTHTHVQTHTHRMKSRVWRYQQLIRLQDSEQLPWEAQSHGCRREDWGAVGAAGIGCSDSTVLARFNLPASSCLINHSSNINFPCISLIFL